MMILSFEPRSAWIQPVDNWSFETYQRRSQYKFKYKYKYKYIILKVQVQVQVQVQVYYT